MAYIIIIIIIKKYAIYKVFIYLSLLSCLYILLLLCFCDLPFSVIGI